METKYVPAWKDKDGNRMVFLAPNHVFDSWDEAFQFQAADFIFYIPMGLTTGGIFEVELDDGKGSFPHVLCDGPWQSQLAIISGPALDAALAEEP